ncbi:MAG: DUF3006 domain-containing protein [Clostridiaceae bacterium]|nr:DUF3006 domain-containing protein [Clostridiaceae bacterium]
MIIDRLTETQGYLEDDGGEIRPVPRGMLPSDAKEGDVLTFDGESYHIDAKKTAERHQKVLQRLKRTLRDL